MKLLSKDEAKSICDKVMAMSKADECRVNLSGSRKGNVRYANNSVSTADFDWKSDKLTMTHDGVNQIVALPPATQDRLSAMYQFMYLVQSKPRAASTVEMPMTTGRKFDRYRYDVHQDVVIDTPLKRITTLHLAKQRDQNDSHTEIWLAPEFHYLPVKVLIVESDGVRYEQIVTRLDVKL